ncbi:MAG: AF1514 family protein [Desulfobacterium sp.]|nr:AF1514 family protein [Desulfobacterium sp.]
MGRIPLKASDTSVEYIRLQVDEPGFDFSKAQDLAKKTALEKTSMPMMLSWKNEIEGTYYPTFECGKTDQPAWIVFAESRGANLTIDINNGAYIFMFLKL